MEAKNRDKEKQKWSYLSSKDSKGSKSPFFYKGTECLQSA
jgi:hypothetical protein